MSSPGEYLLDEREREVERVYEVFAGNLSKTEIRAWLTRTTPEPEEPVYDSDPEPLVQIGDDGKVTIEDSTQRNMIVLNAATLRELIRKLEWAEGGLETLANL